MVEIGGMVSTEALGATTSFLWVLLKWLVVLAILGGAFWFLYQRKQYKFSVKLKVFQHEQFVYYESVAKIKKVDGVPFWFIKGLKELVPVPPATSLYMSSKGRWVAEGYYDRTAGVIWSRDTMSKNVFASTAAGIVKKQGKSGESSIDTHHQPMTTTERSLLSTQITKALMRKGKDMWAMVLPIVFIVALLFIFALILIFWKDIAEPVIALSGSNAQISKDNMLMQQQNIRLYQMLTGGKGNGTSYIIQQLPADQAYNLPVFPEATS